jgi:hypothetical protein
MMERLLAKIDAKMDAHRKANIEHMPEMMARMEINQAKTEGNQRN